MKNILKTALILFLLLILACCDSSSNSTTKVINKKLISGIETGSIGLFQTSSEYTVEGLLDSISYNEDGTCIFSNIVYESSNPFKYISNHLIWTLELSYNYKITSDTELKNSLKTIIPKLVEYWVKNDFQDTNWWYNVINTPNLLGEIVLLAGDTLSDELLSDTLKIMERGCFTKGCKASNYSGANGAWIAYSTLKYGLITGDETLIKAAVDKAITDLSFSKGEGIKTDGSFMQHGNRFYSGSYGQSLVTNYAKIIYLTNGTDYALTQE